MLELPEGKLSRAVLRGRGKGQPFSCYPTIDLSTEKSYDENQIGGYGMKREAMIGALIGVALALVYAIYQVNEFVNEHGPSTNSMKYNYMDRLFDAWFKPGIILAIIGFALGYVVNVSQKRKD